MLFSMTRSKIIVLSFMLLFLLGLLVWAVWTSSANKIPQGGILVMQAGRLRGTVNDFDGSVHPYFTIEKRRVMV